MCSETFQRLCQGEYDSIESDREECIRKDIKKNDVIWTMWWQGEKKAPELVRRCIMSMRKYSKGHPVIVIDEHNYMKYVNLPTAVMNRFHEHYDDDSYLKNCTLDITKLSDIIRGYLLSNYGGLWTDATVMFTKEIDDIFFIDRWNTLGQDNIWYIGRGKWSTFFMAACAGNGLCRFNYDMHIEYWSKKNYFINYLMTDHMFDIAYKESQILKKMIDEVKCGNKKCLTVNRLHNEECDTSVADKFFKEQHFHKLSWRWWKNEADSKNALKTDEGKISWLNYLFEKSEMKL